MTSTDSPRPVILVAIDWYLPAYRAGGPIRSIANLVAALGKEMDFRIVCGNRDLGDSDDLPVEPHTWQRLDGAMVQYLPPSYWTRSTWRRILNEVQPDRLYLNSLYSGPFSRLPWKVAKSMGIPTTLAPRGMLGKGALSIKPWQKKIWLRLQRLTGNYADITWHASTKQESREIKHWFPKADIHIALNLPLPFDPAPFPKADGTLHLLSVGRIHPIKNYSFALQLAGSLSHIGKPIHYRIVGPVEDENEVEKLKVPIKGVTVEFVGPTPPDEVHQHYAWAHLVLVPSFNENFGHSVAEAVANARPVIVSDQTAWSNMTHGESVQCLPLELTSWLKGAQTLLEMNQEYLIQSSAATHQECLLDHSHLEAQKGLFA